jgi:hypothetical protein
MPVDRLGWWVATLKEPTPPSLAYKKGFETSNEISKSNTNKPLTAPHL